MQNEHYEKLINSNQFSISGAGGIIVKKVDNTEHILLQAYFTTMKIPSFNSGYERSRRSENGKKPVSLFRSSS